MRHRGLAVVGALVVGWTLACSDPYQVLEEDEPCVQVAYSVASVTFECTGDGELANRRFKRVRAETTCVNQWNSSDEIEPSFDCAVAVAGVPCKDERVFADDVDAWLSVSPACDALFAGLGDTGGVP